MSNPITDFNVNNLDPFQALVWQFEMGVDEAIADEPLDRFKASESLSRNAATRPGFGASPVQAGGQRGPSVQPQRPAAGAMASPAVGAAPGADGGFLLSDTPHEARQSARDAAAAATNLDELKAAIEKFEGCALKKSASNTVFGIGNVEAKLVLVGEAPGAEEDRQGLPFVGQAESFWMQCCVPSGLPVKKFTLPTSCHGARRATVSRPRLRLQCASHLCAVILN